MNGFVPSRLAGRGAPPLTPRTRIYLHPGHGAQAVEQKRRADGITAVLYPNDATEEGKELRLKQQFFFVSASLQDTIARYLVRCWGGEGGAGVGEEKSTMLGRCMLGVVVL